MKLFSNHWPTGNRGPDTYLERLSRPQVRMGSTQRPLVSVNWGDRAGSLGQSSEKESGTEDPRDWVKG